MSGIAQILFNVQGMPIHVSASVNVPSGSVGQVVAGVDSTGKVRYLACDANGYLITTQTP